jgi:phage shock protein A
MAIRFTQRLSRLIQADAHGIIESLEDRALLLKQHLREAELALQQKRARLATLDEEEQRLTEDAKRLEQAQRNLDEDTRLALAGGREDLARFAIRKLLPKRHEAAALRARIDEIRSERESLAPKVATQEAEFEELRARVHAKLAADARSASTAEPCPEWRAADEEVEMELLRRVQATGGAE